MRVTLALFSAGLATFALLYCVQPILPVLSHEFGVNAGQQQYFTVHFHGDVGGGFAVYWPAVRCHWSQAGDGHRAAAGRLLLLSTMMTSWHGI